MNTISTNTKNNRPKSKGERSVERYLTSLKKREFGRYRTQYQAKGSQLGSFTRNPSSCLNMGDDELRQSVHSLDIENLESNKVSFSKIPQAASQTCQGQRLIKPSIESIPYTGKSFALNPDTVKEFGLSKREQILSTGVFHHKFDHIKQNIEKAACHRQSIYIQDKFRKSILNKSNSQNLRLIKLRVDKMEHVKRRDLLEKQEKWGKFREARDLVLMDYISIKKYQRRAEFW